MRSVVFIFVVLSLFVCACSKTAQQRAIVGRWRLTRVEGGLIGVDIQVRADSPVILMLNSDSTYQRINNGVTDASGTYHLTDTPIYLSVAQPAIVFGPGSIVPYSLARDTLYLGADIDDGFLDTYLKIY